MIPDQVKNSTLTLCKSGSSISMVAILFCWTVLVNFRGGLLMREAGKMTEGAPKAENFFGSVVASSLKPSRILAPLPKSRPVVWHLMQSFTVSSFFVTSTRQASSKLLRATVMTLSFRAIVARKSLWSACPWCVRVRARASATFPDTSLTWKASYLSAAEMNAYTQVPGWDTDVESSDPGAAESYMLFGLPPQSSPSASPIPNRVYVLIPPFRNRTVDKFFS